jgi:hypothetical protein
MKKNIQIVTVPTGKQGWNKGDIVVIHGKAMISDSDTPDWHNLATKWSAKQLLVLSDDEIQEGDLCTMLDSFGNVMLGLPQKYNPLLGHTLNKGLRKTIGSYPQIEGTLPISKKTIQAWIDAGTPGEGMVDIKKNIINSIDDEWSKLNTPVTDTQGNLLIEFEPYIYPGCTEGCGECCPPKPKQENPSIPTQEGIEEKAKSFASDFKNGHHYEGRFEGYQAGYQQALKDLGHIK